VGKSRTPIMKGETMKKLFFIGLCAVFLIVMTVMTASATIMGNQANIADTHFAIGGQTETGTETTAIHPITTTYSQDEATLTACILWPCAGEITVNAIPETTSLAGLMTFDSTFIEGMMAAKIAPTYKIRVITTNPGATAERTMVITSI
jgi:hypothetical protein